MRKVIFCMLLMVPSIFIFAQTKSKKVNVLWGEEHKESRRTTLSDIIGYDDTGIYAVKTSRKLWAVSTISLSSLTLEHYDQKMNPTKSVELELKYEGKDMKYEGIIQLQEEMYLFSSFKNNKLKEKFLFAQRINKKTLRPDKKLQKISDIDFSEGSRLFSGDFSIRLSRDSSKILVFHSLPNKKDGKEDMIFRVFDKNLEMLWEKEIVLPYEDHLFGVEGYKVDNDGNVHLLGTIFKEKRKAKRKGKPNYKYQIISYYDKGEQKVEYPIAIKDKFLTDMQITINDDREIICGGFYSSIGTFSIEGSYFLKINADTKDIVTKSFKEFGLDFITQNMTDKEERKANKKEKKGKAVELYEYDLDDIILRDDGGAVLIGEQYFVRVVESFNTDANGIRNSTRDYFYFYNDIIAINMSPDGNIDWAEKIAKRQRTANDRGFFSSYALSVIKDKLYFVFNDHPKNLFYKGEGKLHNFRTQSKESLVVMVELNNKGEQTREALFSTREADILTRPRVCEQISSDELVLFGQRKKTHRFVKLTFK